jgi:hypothetical protein
MLSAKGVSLRHDTQTAVGQHPHPLQQVHTDADACAHSSTQARPAQSGFIHQLGSQALPHLTLMRHQTQEAATTLSALLPRNCQLAET